MYVKWRIPRFARVHQSGCQPARMRKRAEMKTARPVAVGLTLTLFYSIHQVATGGNIDLALFESVFYVHAGKMAFIINA